MLELNVEFYTKRKNDSESYEIGVMMEEREEIDLRQFVKGLWKKKWIIIIVTILFAAIGAAYSILFVTPKYTATTTLVLASVSKNATESSDAITSSDLSLNTSLVSTYRELVKSKNVISEVIHNLRLGTISENSIRDNLTVSSVSGTQILTISYTDENPEYAAMITNQVAEVFMDRIKDIYKIENIKIVDRAEQPTVASNIDYKKDIIKFTLIGFALSIVIVFIANFFDTTVKTKEDIESEFKLHVLCTLPVYETQMQKIDTKHKNNMGGDM